MKVTTQGPSVVLLSRVRLNTKSDDNSDGSSERFEIAVGTVVRLVGVKT